MGSSVTRFHLLLQLLTSLSSATTVASASVAVHTLTPDNFESSVNDGGLWFVKFYAPWCGHCKKMAPVLDKVAPQLEGVMSIGKMDCTVHKKFCDGRGVRGYPSLEVHRAGETFDYPGGRSADAIKSFAKRMNAPAVASVERYQEVLDTVAKDSDTGVVFLLHDPKGTSSSSSDLAKTFNQVARKLQATATFAFFSPDASSDEVVLVGASTAAAEAFVARVEAGVPSRFYDGPPDGHGTLLDFVRSSNVAAVTKLDAHNFRETTDAGRLMAVQMIDGGASAGDVDQTTTAQLIPVALAHPDHTIAYMDGVKWRRFVAGFGVETLPAYVLMDYGKGLYYDEDGKGRKPTSLKDLLETYERGEMSAKKQSKGDGSGPLPHWVTWKHGVAFLLGVAVLVFGLAWFFDVEEEVEQAGEGGKDATAEKKTNGPDVAATDETKKEK